MGKSLSDAKAFHGFMWREMLISSGLVNGVINGVLCYFIVRHTVSLGSYLFSTLLTNFILAIILCNVYPAVVRMKCKKQPTLVIPYTASRHMVAALFPQNKYGVKVVNGLLTLILSTLFTMGIIGCLLMPEVGRFSGAILRGIDCGIFSVICCYFSAIFVFFEAEEKN